MALPSHSGSASGSAMGCLSFFDRTFRHDWLLKLQKLFGCEGKKTPTKIISRLQLPGLDSPPPPWVRVTIHAGFYQTLQQILPIPPTDGARDSTPANPTQSDRFADRGAMPRLPVAQRRHQPVRGPGHSELSPDTPAGSRSAGAVLGGARSAVPGPVVESRCVCFARGGKGTVVRWCQVLRRGNRREEDPRGGKRHDRARGQRGACVRDATTGCG